MANQLLEREHERGLLQQAWRRAGTGRGSAWLVCAEAGGGKTHLLREVTRNAGGPVRWGTAEPVLPPDPYLAVMQALRRFRPAPRRAESVDRAVECLEQLAGDGAITVVFDDLHFADEGTHAIFVRLAALCATRPWLILGAFRPGEGPELLRTVVTELVGQGHAQRLDLEPLSRAAVATLIADVRGRPAGEAEVDAVLSDSGGNPWFVEALARGAGAISAARDRMLLRLDRLNQAIPGATHLLAALAPAGEPVPHAVLASLGGGDGPELRRILRGLRDAAVLHEREGAWQFRHELLRRSFLEDMLDADRREAHRRLAEALEQWSLVSGRWSDEGPSSDHQSLITDRRRSAAILAMHYAAAGDVRAAEWAMRAARAASAIDAHAEALAQLERALSFPLQPEVRRTALRAAARMELNLGRLDESRQRDEAAIGIPGGEPETISWLHLRAAETARLTGDTAIADAHMDAAEQALAGLPACEQMVRVAMGRALHAAAHIDPERTATAVARACELVRALADRQDMSGYELEARCYAALSRLDAGDPSGFVPFQGMLELADARPVLERKIVRMALFAYAGAVRSLFHAEADHFREWLFERVQRHNFEWAIRIGPYRMLELVQRGAFPEARALLETEPAPPARAVEHTVLLCTRVHYEARAGSPARARSVLDAAHPPDEFAHLALLDLAHLELDSSVGSAETRAPADIYARAEGRRFARVAGTAAVALARAGEAVPPRPVWLAAASPLGVFWEWTEGIAARHPARLRAVAARLEEMRCPYEAALALRDAGDLHAAYRALRTLGAARAREHVAGLLRAAGRPIPRGPRVGGAAASLTDTERAVCRLVAEGATNDGIALELNMSVRTVEAYLSRMYENTGQRGRVALAIWWRERTT